MLETPAHVFSLEYCKILKNTYFEEHVRTTGSIAKALIVLLLSFVLFQTYKTFSLFNFQKQTRQQKFKNTVAFPTIVMSLQYKNREKGKIPKLN